MKIILYTLPEANHGQVSKAELNITDSQQLLEWMKGSSLYLRYQQWMFNLKEEGISIILSKYNVHPELVQLAKDYHILILEV